MFEQVAFIWHPPLFVLHSSVSKEKMESQICHMDVKADYKGTVRERMPILESQSFKDRCIYRNLRRK